MGETTFRGKLLKDCTLEELHDARAWAETRLAVLYGPDNRPIPRDDAEHLWDGMARQIQEELDARKSRPPPQEPKIMGEEVEELVAWLREAYEQSAAETHALRASLTRAEEALTRIAALSSHEFSPPDMEEDLTR